MVTRSADLDRLKPWARRFDAVEVLLGDPHADAALAAALERDYLECGCRPARHALVVTAMVALPLAAWLGRPLAAQPAEWWIAVAAAVTIVPLAVMLAVVVRARRRLAARIRALQGANA